MQAKGPQGYHWIDLRITVGHNGGDGDMIYEVWWKSSQSQVD